MVKERRGQLSLGKIIPVDVKKGSKFLMSAKLDEVVKAK